MSGSTVQKAVTSDGVCIAFEVQGRGPAILFVHGLGDDRHLWRPVIAHLERDYTCVALDLRGHGESDDADDYDPFGLARDLAAVVAASGLERPSVVGHSLGGFAATLYAARAPVNAVVNIDQPLALAALAETVRPLAEPIRSGRVAEVLWSVLESLGLGPLPPATQAHLRATRAKLRGRALLGLWAPLLHDGPEAIAAAVDEAIGDISAPYLSLHGVDLPGGYAEWLAARIPGASLESWHGCGHFPHLVAPARFAAHVRQHLHVDQRPRTGR